MLATDKTWLRTDSQLRPLAGGGGLLYGSRLLRRKDSCLVQARKWERRIGQA